MNKRVEETILGGSSKEGQDSNNPDYRILPKHMYGVSNCVFRQFFVALT